MYTFEMSPVATVMEKQLTKKMSDLIGETTKEKYIQINDKIDLNTEEAKELWLNGLRDKIK